MVSSKWAYCQYPHLIVFAVFLFCFLFCFFIVYVAINFNSSGTRSKRLLKCRIISPSIPVANHGEGQNRTRTEADTISSLCGSVNWPKLPLFVFHFFFFFFLSSESVVQRLTTEVQQHSEQKYISIHCPANERWWSLWGRNVRRGGKWDGAFCCFLTFFSCLWLQTTQQLSNVVMLLFLNIYLQLTIILKKYLISTKFQQP